MDWPGNELRYVHLRRNDDTNLASFVESSTNLVSAVWTNAGYTVMGTNVLGGAYDEVTYRIPPDAPETYIHASGSRFIIREAGRRNTAEAPFGTAPPSLARYTRDNNSGGWYSGRVILSRECGEKQ